MKVKYTREELIKIAAEKVRIKEEEAQRAENEYYYKITHGTPWLVFKIVVGFCTLMMVLTTIDILVDGPSQELDQSEWRIDRELYIPGHQSIKVGDDLFVPEMKDWLGHIDDSFEITYSSIFRTGKWLNYNREVSENVVLRESTIRRRSIYTWFPYFQIIMLIPLATFLFKRQKPWFKFARIASMVLITPAIILVTIITLL